MKYNNSCLKCLKLSAQFSESIQLIIYVYTYIYIYRTTAINHRNPTGSSKKIMTGPLNGGGVGSASKEEITFLKPFFCCSYEYMTNRNIHIQVYALNYVFGQQSLCLLICGNICSFSLKSGARK